MQILRDYALKFVGLPYKWGGAHPLEGYDCSGFVQELLASAGEDPPGDQSAQAIYNHFQAGRASVDKWGLGSLAFFGDSVTKITHVAFCLDQFRMIEASGGDQWVKFPEDAILRKAMIRIRLIRSRSDLVAVLKPYYRKIGQI